MWRNCWRPAMADIGLTVTGGAGGVTARYDDLDTLARLTDDLALTLGRVSAASHLAVVDPDVVASAVLDPVGVARFEEKLLAALDGPDGLVRLGLGFGELAMALRAVAFTYRVVDDAHARGIDALRWTAGYYASPVLVAGAAGLVGLAATPGGPAVLLAGYRLAGGRIDWQQLLTDHPGLVDDVVGAGPGLIAGLTPFNVHDAPGAARLLAEFYPDGVPVFEGSSVDGHLDGAPPAGFADLLAGLSYRSDQARPGEPDQIDVRVITQPDGTRSYIVDIPGTKVWDPPGGRPDLADLGTNLHAMAGDPTAREAAVADALRRAGAGPDDPVMLIGHSQGGIVAARAAHDSADGSFGFNVTHVVTAGAPIGRVEIPPRVQVLSLENAHDIVPHLDAADNPDQPNRTTVTFSVDAGSIGDDHSVATYASSGRSLDGSADPSVIAFRGSAGAFLSTGDSGRTVSTSVYGYTRG
jgi:hypothetical protein